MRVDADIFYDADIVGATGIERHGHRGKDADHFFVAHDPLAAQPHYLVRAAYRPWLFAWTLFGFGFFAVFVRQADIITQVILGAPIFEEALKFGLALLLCLALVPMATRSWDHPAWLAMRLPVALLVGAGFGWLEHAITYSRENDASYAWRVAFHALSAGASMVAYQAALRADDVRTRWLALLPSIFIHYLNNYAALVLGVGSLAARPLGVAAAVWSHALVVALGVTMVAMAAAPARTRELLAQAARRLPVETARGA